MKQPMRWARTLLALTLVAAGAVVTATPAQAAETSFLLPADQHYLTDCGRFWPSTGYFQTSHVSGGSYAATLDFTMTQAQINSLACVSSYLELDFRIFGFSTPPEWDNYTVSTNLPGAIHDVATMDSTPNEATPGVTRIGVASLQAGVEYSATLAFNQPLNAAGGSPRVSIEWVPSYWASSVQEQAFCALWRQGQGDAECVFGKTRAFLSHGYNNNVSLIFDGYRWWEFYPTTATSGTPPTTDVAPTYPTPGTGVGAGTTFLGAPQLTSGQTMMAGQYIVSPNGQFCLLMQYDGNLVLYGPPFIPLWQSGTSGSQANRVVMQSDGNLVMYRANNTSVWQSGTSGASGVSMQNDGNLVVYSGSTPKWNSGTGGHASPIPRGGYLLGGGQQMDLNYYLTSPDGRITLLLQADGNLILYGPGYHVLWHSATNGLAVTRLAMQTDGNLVLYRANNTVVWQSGTNNSSADRVVVQNDGNLVIYRPNNTWVWQSGTGGQI